MIMGGIGKYLVHLLDLVPRGLRNESTSALFLEEQNISSPNQLARKRKMVDPSKASVDAVLFMDFFSKSGGGSSLSNFRCCFCS